MDFPERNVPILMHTWQVCPNRLLPKALSLLFSFRILLPARNASLSNPINSIIRFSTNSTKSSSTFPEQNNGLFPIGISITMTMR